MGTTTELRQEIKHRFVPFMAERGFTLDMRDAPVFFLFRKITAEMAYFCDVQWDKYGRPRFSLVFGRCSPEGGAAYNGDTIPAEEMKASWCQDAGTLSPKSSPRSVFRQDHSWLKQLILRTNVSHASAPVDQLTEWFKEVERYWESGKIGPHLWLWKR